MKVEDIDRQKVAAAAAKGQHAWIQFTGPERYTPELLEHLDSICEEFGRHVEVRFLHHAVFDAGVLRHLPSVHNLTVDCCGEFINEEGFTKLAHLRGLMLETDSIRQPDFLAGLNVDDLEVLALTGRRKSKLSLTPLGRAKRLRKLTLENHHKGIEGLSGAAMLETLVLWSLPRAQSLEFVAGMAPLKNLSLIRGGRETLDDLQHPSLEGLGVTWVNGLQDLGPLRRFPKLSGLGVSDQVRLRWVDIAGTKLESLSLSGCKNLTEIRGLETQDQLKNFQAHFTGLPLDALRDRAWPPSLELISLRQTNQKWNQATAAEMANRGYVDSRKRVPDPDLDVYLYCGYVVM